MKHSLVYFACLTLLFVAGCSTIKYVPVETIKEVHVRDSVYLRDTLIKTELQKAKISDFVDVKDTLVLSTELARAVSYIDTTKAILKGTIENIKPYVEKPVQIQEKIVYRDSVVVKEVPVEVEVPKPYVPMFWIVCSIIGIMAVGIEVMRVISKLS